MIEVLNPYPDNIFDNLRSLLSKINVPVVNANNRRKFPRHRAMLFGLSKGRYNGIIGISYYSMKYPEISEELEAIGKTLCPFEFNSVYLLKNTESPPHRDGGNVGISMLCSFGDYEGCNIFIEGQEYDAREKPICFDGSKLTHWNSPLLAGDKFSLVYYNAKFV